MAKPSESQMERAALDALAGKEPKNDPIAEAPGSIKDNFNIVAGKPLPDGFENPPCGKEGHLCVDQIGNYQPEWSQLKIEKRFDHDQDPLVFGGAQPYSVPLDEWVDAPPRLLESLKSAVETTHTSNVRDQIKLGTPSVVKKTERRRFVWDHMKSA